MNVLKMSKKFAGFGKIPWWLWLNRTVSSGASKARFNVLKITVSAVKMMYGIAYFPIGLAKDNSRK